MQIEIRKKLRGSKLVRKNPNVVLEMMIPLKKNTSSISERVKVRLLRATKYTHRMIWRELKRPKKLANKKRRQIYFLMSFLPEYISGCFLKNFLLTALP